MVAPTAPQPARHFDRMAGVAVWAVAVICGLPSLGGGFLGGDDIQLVRDHVLVNHPSLTHAAKLFTIVHRDLYQPIALLSFSVDFWVARLLGYAPQPGQHPPGVWVFHLTNVLLHAGCAWLVYALIRRLTNSGKVAVMTAVVFAAHPLGAEAVAWVNGRMMLLSTLFLLATVILMDLWCDRLRVWAIVLALVCVALCMMSKVRIALPVLLLIPVFVRRRRPPVRWWVGWVLATVIAAVFVLVNYRASSGMLESGARHLGQHRIARTFAALGWYLSRTIIPWGLAPYHPARPQLGWTDPQVVTGVVIVAVAVAIWMAWSRRHRWVLAGGVWFLASIAVTLPLIPSRNVLVAQRYTYLPDIGLYWLIATALMGVAARVGAHRRVAMMLSAAGVVVLGAMVAMFWRTSAQYRDDVERARRFVRVYPDEPGALTQLGWALYRAGRYDEAEQTAATERDTHEPADNADIHQLIGMCRLKRGDTRGALRALREAVRCDPNSGIAQARLARALAEANRIDDAITAYRRAIELAPGYNPGRIQLARLLLEQNHLSPARRQYEAVLDNNPYDPVAINALAEIEIRQGQYESALVRLQALLKWMPENVAARINTGLCLLKLNRVGESRAAYRRALQRDPDAQPAVMNLANLLIAAQRRDQAQRVLDAYLKRHPADREIAVAACLNLAAMDQTRRAADVVVRALRLAPESKPLRGWYAWTCCVADRWQLAVERVSVVRPPDPPIVSVVRVALHLHEHQPQQAIDALALLTAARLTDQNVFEALTTLLEKHAASEPGDPWPYYLLTQAAAARGDTRMAELAAKAFKQRTDDPKLHERIDSILSSIPR